MKILVVGGDGQLGSDCWEVLNQSHTLVIPSLSDLDLRIEKNVDTYITQENPDVIINCAAYTAVDDCEKNQELAWQVNSDGPRFLAKACEKVDARLIHISTDYVFSGRKPAPEAYTETDSVNPLSQYGKSKLAGEKAVQEYCRDHLILRTAWLYSAHGPNFLKTMLRLSMANPERELRVVNDQYGSLTWSHTLARQIQILLGEKLTGIVHTTSEGYATWYGAACYFLDKMRIPHNLAPCTTAEYPTPAERPQNSILANTKLDEAGISTFVDWQKDIDVFVEKFREKLTKEFQAS